MTDYGHSCDSFPDILPELRSVYFDMRGTFPRIPGQSNAEDCLSGRFDSQVKDNVRHYSTYSTNAEHRKLLKDKKIAVMVRIVSLLN